MKRAFAWLLMAACLASPAVVRGVEFPSGDIWTVKRVLPDGTERREEGAALLIEGFSGPVTYLSFVSGAERVILGTPSGPVETASYRVADPTVDLVVLEAEPAGAKWPTPEIVTVETGDTLRAFARNVPQGYRATTGGTIEVPPKLRMYHLPLCPVGAAPIFDVRARLIGLGSHIRTEGDILGFAIPAQYVLSLREKDGAAAGGRPLTELAALEPAFRDPLTPAGATLCGGVLSREGRQYDALAYLERAALDELPETFFEIGAANSHLQRRTSSIQALRHAVELRPCFVQALIHLGAENFMVGRYAVAESLYIEATKCDPGYGQTYTNIGGVQHVEGERWKAEQSFRKTLELDPDYDAARFNLAVILKSQGKTKEAEELLEEMRLNGSRMAERLEKLLGEP